MKHKLKGDKKQNGLKKDSKKIKKAVPIAKQGDDEEINSDYMEEAENQRPIQLAEASDSGADENEDQRRLRMAKQILQSTKQEMALKQRNDDFFSDFQGVQMNDEDKRINVALMEKIIEKHKIFTPIAEQYNREFKKEAYKGHTLPITATQMDSFGKVMYSCSKDCSIIKWDMETKKKEFLQREYGKHGDGHNGEILAMSLNYDNKILATAGKDQSVKLWDTNSNKLIDTLKLHRKPIYGLKFGLNSNNLASISCDRTFNLWDASQRAPIDTFYGHQAEGNDIDCLGSEDFVTCGYDRQVIVWKTKFGSQLIYSGHSYSIDCVRAISSDMYVTGSADGSMGLWNVNKKKALQMHGNVHGGNWMTAIGTQFNSDLVVTGAYNGQLQLYQYSNKNLQLMKQLDSSGIVNNLQVQNNMIISVESQEHRLGRWITCPKAKNQIVVYL